MKTFSILALAALTISSSALACPSGTHDVRGDGQVILSASEVYFTASNSNVQVTNDLVLTTNPDNKRGNTILVTVVDQKKDSQGIFSTTFQISRTDSRVVTRSRTIKITSNYMGNGGYARSCGGVTEL